MYRSVKTAHDNGTHLRHAVCAIGLTAGTRCALYACMTLVNYTIRIGRKRVTFWLRDESAPNLRVHATRYASMRAAEDAADIVRENVRTAHPDVRFTFTNEPN